MRTKFVQSLMEAGLRADRAEFDRVFDAGFPVVYALAFQRASRDREIAELLLTQLLTLAIQTAEIPTSSGGSAEEQPTQHPTRGAA